MKKGQKKRTKKLEERILTLYSKKKENGERVYSLNDIGRDKKVNLTGEGVRYILKALNKY